MKKLYVILIAICALVLLSIKVNSEEYTQVYKVNASALNVRLAPGEQFEIFYVLANGEEVSGKVSNGEWTEVNCYGYKGFVSSKFISKKNELSPNMKPIGAYKITGYNPYCSHCCGKSDGITASGKRAVVGDTIAMSGVKFGTRVYIKGLGYYTVHDRGVGPGVIDIACNSDSECYAITGQYEVYIVE